ncbi:hypothetical protein [Burkholderia ambifaria]|uniref:hypothetical protein n=1 Tax=Burkholderia ambifaria TaxID=152480 RepID=UPI00158831F5|nr:hypothetical protein [Burkholderia ambifaria]
MDSSIHYLMESNRAMRLEYAIARVRPFHAIAACRARSRVWRSPWARACRPAPDTFANLSPAGLALFDAALDWAAGRR